MKAIVLEKPGRLKLVETDAPRKPEKDEVLARVKRVGVCGSDLHAFAGNQNFFTYPRIMGHELAVEIVSIGETNTPVDFGVGDLCCVNPYLHCGSCIACRQGKTNCCTQLRLIGIHQDGGMQEKLIVPIDNLLKADGVPVEQLALVEMLCIGAHAVNRANVSADEHVLVIGAGPIGMATAVFAKEAGANVILMEINKQRLDFCRDKLNVAHLIDANDDPLNKVKSLLNGDLPTAVFDCTGNNASMENAFHYVAHGGSLVLVGHIKGNITFSDPHFHSHEMTLIASRNATAKEFQQVIACLKAGKINLSPWITHFATPETIVDDFPTWLDPETGAFKAMLTFDAI
ncbi:MAG: zinc-binding alcohol dehydrogenase family protein [Chloroflexota bacterium]